MKLTMVSMYCNGRAFTKFIELPQGENGKTYIPHSTYLRFLRELGADYGDTITMDLPNAGRRR